MTGAELIINRNDTFVYMGEDQEQAPMDVQHVKIMHDTNVIVESIANGAFWNRIRLVTINLCSNNTNTNTTNIKTIGDWSFQGCVSLREIHIPNGVVSIGGRAFSGCSNLVKAILPTKSLKTIGNLAFD